MPADKQFERGASGILRGAPRGLSGERAAAVPPPPREQVSRLTLLRRRFDDVRVNVRVKSEGVLRLMPAVLAVLAAVTLIWKYLLEVGPLGREVILVGEQALVIAFGARLLIALAVSAHPLSSLVKSPVAHLLAIAGAVALGRGIALDAPLSEDRTFFFAAAAVKVYLIVLEANELWIAGFTRLRLSPSLTLALSFVALIGAGTGLLLDERATPREKPISPVDALFTATSAACVTGLSVRDTGTEFTRFGQVVILGLIQIGGLGIMTYAAFFAAIFGRGLSIRDKVLMREMLQTEALDRLPVVLGLIVLTTVLVEGIGAALLFRLDASLAGGERVFAAAFHSVSAFCNAGFGLYPDSLGRFEKRPDVLAVLTVLITLGGLGYVVILDIVRKTPRAIAAALGLRRRKGPPPRPFSLQTRMVVTISSILVIAGAALFTLYEWRADATYGRLAPLDRFANAVFMSVSCRTAGFNVAPIGAFTAGSLLVMIALMFIGGSPGSTAGGVKTTTFGVLTARVWGLLRRREEIEVAGRTIPRKLIATAIAVVFVQAALIFVVTLALMYTDPKWTLQQALFEVVSAFTTTGLSTGITADLSRAGKVLITLGMFVGRIGPLTLLLAMAERPGTPPAYRYPDGKVMIG